ncbi:hypothetical protein P368_16155 [Comamonas thiooxydans]|nr:hypothetical protein P365_20410 [Comamonas thiooxydans]KGH10359.1 hypothetical protein P368_16155 [Comamonas thiooxydans]
MVEAASAAAHKILFSASQLLLFIDMPHLYFIRRLKLLLEG